jgi:hypothetical protein
VCGRSWRAPLEGASIAFANSVSDPAPNLPVRVLNDTNSDMMMLMCGGGLGIVVGLFARRIDIVRFYSDMAADPRAFPGK